MFEKFGEYMYYLLFGPLKKVRQKVNQFYILFKVLGKIFDGAKADFYQVREESMLISASEPSLLERGKERDMPRLEGEDLENYRIRLISKRQIAEMAGTIPGILLALETLGYERSYIEQCYLYDPMRWAEFDIYLGSQLATGIKDIRLVAAEVDKVKPASGKANYLTEQVRMIEIESEITTEGLVYMMCGLQRCGEPVTLY